MVDFNVFKKYLLNFVPDKRAPVFELEKLSDTKFKIFIVTFLSTRTKDEKTIEVAKKLFKYAKSFEDILKLENLEELLYGVGFYKTKAVNLKKIALEITKNGFPKTLDEITSLPGIGPKVGKIILNRIYGYKLIGVDTHVHRILNRIGVVNTKTPEETDKILETKEYLPEFNKKLVALGQTICKPVKPNCNLCYFKKICNYAKTIDL